MKKIMLLSFVLVLMLTGCNAPAAAPAPTPTPAVKTTSIWEEQTPSGAYDLTGKDLIFTNLTSELEKLLQADFDDQTKWSSKLPTDYNPNKVFENGKNPGLSIKSIHDSNITGKDVGIAVIGTSLYRDHTEYAENIATYEKLDDSDAVSSTYTSAVAAISVGKTTGVAPGAKLHYFDIGDKTPDQTLYTRTIENILTYNAKLAIDKKIRIILIPSAVETPGALSAPFKAAVEKAKKERVEVLYWGSHPVTPIGRNPIFHPDYTGGYEKQGNMINGLAIPVSARTLPRINDPQGYHFDTQGYHFTRYGEPTWALPYVAGLYALSCEVKPDVTLDEMFELALQTASSVETEGKETIEGLFNTWEYFYALKPDYTYAWQNENYGKNNALNRTLKETLVSLSPFDTAEGYTLYKEGRYEKGALTNYTFDTTNVFEGSEARAAEIIETYKDPGLGVRSLHARGITGKTVNVGIIDQYLILDHPEYKAQIKAYRDVDDKDNKENIGSYHGPAVTSILAGKTTGVAPDVGIYYAAAPSWYKDAQYFADALYWIIEENKKLGTDEKIRIVSVSASPSSENNWFKNGDSWTEAVAAAEREGIYVIDCRAGVKTGFVFAAYSDGENLDDPSTYKTGFPDLNGTYHFATTNAILAPASRRTFAQQKYPDEYLYRYEASGGLSWAVPYVAGVFALGWQMDPDATGDELRALVFKSAETNESGHKIISPVQFIKAVEDQK